MSRFRKYSKLISAAIAGTLGVGTAFGLDVTPEQQQAILGLTPVLTAAAVYLAPSNDAPQSSVPR